MTDTAAKRIERLREQIRGHDHAYYVLGEPLVSVKVKSASLVEASTPMLKSLRSPPIA